MTDGAKEESSKGGRIATSLYILAALVVIFAGIKAAERIFVPFLLSVFIAVIVSPVMLWLRRRGVGSAVASSSHVGDPSGDGPSSIQINRWSDSHRSRSAVAVSQWRESAASTLACESSTMN